MQGDGSHKNGHERGNDDGSVFDETTKMKSCSMHMDLAMKSMGAM